MTRQTTNTSEDPAVSAMTIILSLPGCHSLKEKRGRLASILNRLRKAFNISISEIDRLDSWQTSVIACAVISNDRGFNQQVFSRVIAFLENNFPDEPIIEYHTS